MEPSSIPIFLKDVLGGQSTTTKNFSRVSIGGSRMASACSKKNGWWWDGPFYAIQHCVKLSFLNSTIVLM